MGDGRYATRLIPHLGEIVEEFTDRASNSPTANGEEYKDALKEKPCVRRRTSICF